MNERLRRLCRPGTPAGIVFLALSFALVLWASVVAIGGIVDPGGPDQRGPVPDELAAAVLAGCAAILAIFGWWSCFRASPRRSLVVIVALVAYAPIGLVLAWVDSSTVDAINSPVVGPVLFFALVIGAPVAGVTGIAAALAEAVGAAARRFAR